MRLVFAAAVLLAPAAHAQSVPPSEVLAAADAGSTEVVIRANRFSVFRGDQAFSTVDLDADALRSGGSIDRSLKQATQAALFRRSSSLSANPTVQGLSLRAIAPSGAGRALVTVDGIPQNDPFGGWVIWAAIPQDALRSAHIVRGAGGGAYGAGALTGVVDLSLIPPQDQTGYLRLEVGEFGAHQVTAGGALGDVSAHYSTRTLRGDTAVRAPLRGAADVATSGEDQALLVNYQGEVCAGLCGRLDLLATAYDSRRDTGLTGATAQASGDTVSASFTRPATSTQAGLRVQAWRRTSDLANRSVSVGAGRDFTTLANDQVATPATGTGFNAAVRSQLADTAWEVGLDIRHLEGRADEYYRYVGGAATRFRSAGGRSELAGLYAEGSHAMGRVLLAGAIRADSWTSAGGFRQETDRLTGASVLDLKLAQRSFSVVSARLGATYRLDDGMILRAAGYNGFRPPSLNELYRPFRVGNDVTEANAELKPETLTGAEIGLRTRHIDAGLFYNVLRHPVTNVTVGIGPGSFPTAGFIPAGGTLRQRQNGGDITAWGFEGRGTWRVTPQVSAVMSGTLTHARTEAGLRPAQAPDYSLSLGIEADLAPVTVAADITFDGEAFEDDLNRLVLKPSQRLDLRLDYAVRREITLTMQISNALDSAIQIARSQDGIVSFDTGRRVTLGLRLQR